MGRTAPDPCKHRRSREIVGCHGSDLSHLLEPGVGHISRKRALAKCRMEIYLLRFALVVYGAIFGVVIRCDFRFDYFVSLSKTGKSGSHHIFGAAQLPFDLDGTHYSFRQLLWHFVSRQPLFVDGVLW